MKSPESPSNWGMVPKVGGLELGSLPLPQALTPALHNPPFPPPPEPGRLSLLCYFSPLEFPCKNESPPEKFPLGCVTPPEEQTRGAVSGSGGTTPALFSSHPAHLGHPKSCDTPKSALEKQGLGHSPVQLSCLLSWMHPGILTASC